MYITFLVPFCKVDCAIKIEEVTNLTFSLIYLISKIIDNKYIEDNFFHCPTPQTWGLGFPIPPVCRYAHIIRYIDEDVSSCMLIRV